MRIAFLSEASLSRSVGGIAANVFNWARGLEKIGHEVTIFTRRFDRKNIDERELRLINLKTLDVHPRLFTLNELYFARRTADYLRKISGDYDIFHGQEICTSLPLALEESLREKAVVTLNGFWPLCGQGFRYQLRDYSICSGCNSGNLRHCIPVGEQNRFLRPFHKFVYMRNYRIRRAHFKRLSHVIAVSKFLAKLINKHTGKRTEVVYNPIEDEWFEERDIRYGTGNILYAGRMVGWKGIDVLLRAMKIILPRYRCKLLIAGPIKNDYDKLADTFGLSQDVSFLGSLDRSRLMDAYKNCDVVVVPSIGFETFGRTAAEAMAMRKPVVGTNHGALPELIKDGESGFLVPPGDARALADRIVTLLGNVKLQEEMGARGREFVRLNCGSQKITGQLEEIYRAVMRESR